MRVFIGTNEIAQNYSDLNSGFRSLGIDSKFQVSNWQKHNLPAEAQIPNIDTAVSSLREQLLRSKQPRFLTSVVWKALGVFRRTLNAYLRLIWALRIIARHDVFVFGFGSSLFYLNLDMYLLRLMPSKRIISVLMHGSEALPPWADGAWVEDGEPLTPSRIALLTRRTCRRIRRHERLAHQIIGDPISTSFFAVKPFVNSYLLGRPIDAERINSQGQPSSGFRTKLSIVHVPSHRGAKGSSEILKIIAKLKLELGEAFDFQLIENVSNQEVIEVLSGADLLVDQMYSDRYWSRVSAEAACFGVPSIVGGYAWEDLKSAIPSGLQPPGFYSHPENFEEKLRWCVENPAQLRAVGRNARFFVTNQLDLQAVSSRWASLLSGQSAPKDLLFDPKNQNYWRGCGQNESISRSSAREAFEQFGMTALIGTGKTHLDSLIRREVLPHPTA